MPARVKVRVIHTDEELTIARSVNRVLNLGNQSPEKNGAARGNAMKSDCDIVFIGSAAGGWLFPSIGAVNTALTAMANALRVGDHLLERFK